MHTDSKNRLSGAKALALVGLMAATVECGKLALSFLPNIEVVTLLLALYGYVFGWYGVSAAVVFVCIEPMIYGFGPWLLTYMIYWPAVAVAFMFLARLRVKKVWVITLLAILLTMSFGIISSVVDVMFYLGINKHYFANLIIYYARGVVFYVVQVACNAVLFLTVFSHLSRKLELLKTRMLL